MLQQVDVGQQTIASYAASAGEGAVARLRELAAPLRGARVLHLSATPYGGGVAEILRSEVPLLRDLGLDADWQLITGDEAFFRVTKRMHNGLQGAPGPLTRAEQETYLAYSARNAGLLVDDYDIVVVHDPQPLAIAALRDGSRARWVWRCHIDTSEPEPEVWDFVRPFVDRYHAAVFTLGGFVPPGFPVPVEIVPPAIDPESPKNIELPEHVARRVLEWIGVETDRPLVTQVARFDPWKDPLGVIEAYRLARAEVPALQLALAGSMALDDPEGWDLYRRIEAEAHADPGIHVFTNLTGVGNIEVNAFQRLSDVVVQKSLREGFGLVVSEALWKRTPVVAGRAGGIPLQMQDGCGGVLVGSVEECAAALVELLRDPGRRYRLGEAGHRLVHDRFLLTRLLADELRLWSSQLTGAPGLPVPPLGAGVGGELRDPVCGMQVDPRDPRTARHIELDDRDHWFCSGSCAAEFARDPERFRRAEPADA
ncbi:MAG TPA: glycosyltransferase [Acidimicrobiales bacterium]